MTQRLLADDPAAVTSPLGTGWQKTPPVATARAVAAFAQPRAATYPW